MSLSAAILGFLELDPTTGYTLKQRFEGSVGTFWSVTQSQIYRELHALERSGQVVSRRERNDGKPDRKVYRLTPSGQLALDAWRAAPLEPLQLRHPLLLKLVFSAEVPPKQVDEGLATYGDALAGTRAELAARLSMKEIFSLARSRREAEIWRLSIAHGLAWCDAELAWINKARRTLRKTP